MKKILYIIAAISLLNSFSAKAQEDKIYGGFKVAPNFSIITDKVTDQWKTGIGFNIGYFEVLELTNKVNLQAEILINKTTFVQNLKEGEFSSKTTRTTSNLNLPIMAKYRITDEFAVGLGYQFSLGILMESKLNEKIKNSGPAGYSNESKSESQGIKNNGFFLDASYTKGKSMFGFRLLNPKMEQIESYKTVNASFYFGYKLF